MRRIMRWWTGYLLVELSGYSPERFLNLCSYHGIDIWNLMNIKGKYRFYVSAADFKELVTYVRKSKTRLIILEKIGLPFQLRRHRKRKWFAAGVLLCGICLYLLSLYIWDIDFDGNSYFTDELLMETLLEQGYEAGMRRDQIVCDDLEMMLRETYPDITWVSAQIKGTRLLIQIRENTGIQVAENEEKAACDLVASCDGVITEIITRSGTPLVKAGDTVTSGQVLVSGTVELFNDSKEKTGEHQVEADATILAQTTLEYADRFSLTYPTKWYTGKRRYQLSVWFFEKEIFIDGNIRGFDTYDIVSEPGQIRIGEDFLLPVRWQWNILREYEEIQAIYSREQAISIAEANCQQFFENLLEKGVQIIEKNVRIDMMGDECIAEGTLTVIQEIGKQVPITPNLGEQEETDD